MSTLGVILVIVGAALMVTEAHVPTHGALGTGAVAALTAGVVLGLLVTAALLVRRRRRGPPCCMATSGPATSWSKTASSPG